MKINIGSLALIAALGSTANAWSFYANGKTIGKDQNVDIPCDQVSVKEGQKISFYEGFWENCVFHVFKDSSCKSWAGTTEDDWKGHTLGTDVKSYSVECSV